MSETIDTELQAILAGGREWAVPSRRAFPRFSASYPVFLEFDPAFREPVTGITVNIARSGFLATFEEPIRLGATCEITFLPRQRYRPELVECPHCGSEFPVLEPPDEPVRGTVVRVERPREGTYAVAVVFETPLETVGGQDREEPH